MEPPLEVRLVSDFIVYYTMSMNSVFTHLPLVLCMTCLVEQQLCILIFKLSDNILLSVIVTLTAPFLWIQY